VAKTRNAQETEEGMKQFLYRTLDSDDDGDPYDFGVVNARDLDDADVFWLLSELSMTMSPMVTRICGKPGGGLNIAT
jgi:hypothetical protein